MTEGFSTYKHAAYAAGLPLALPMGPANTVPEKHKAPCPFQLTNLEGLVTLLNTFGGVTMHGSLSLHN